VHDLNQFVRGWAGYFRYGNSALQLTKIKSNVEVRVKSTLYWRSASVSTPWEYQGYAMSPWGWWSEDVRYTHGCTRGTTNYWYTRADGSSIYQGLQVSYADQSPQTLISCT
jgi:Group II intron, maturase-specific domain